MNPLRIFFLLLLAAGASSAAPVVINEIMYHAPNDLDDLEFIELYNQSGEAVDLRGWTFTRGIEFKFPTGAKIEGKGYLVLARNRERFQEYYKIEPFGVFTGSLKHKSERIELSDARGKKVDAVKYGSRAPWPAAPDGHGSSLERISPSIKSSVPENWTSSPRTDPLKPAGTPGKQNAAFSANLAPIVSDLRFSPSMPAPGESVRVEADVEDSDGVKEVQLRYRLAGPGFEREEKTMPMTLSANHHFSATIPGETNGLLRFRIEALDAKGARRFFPAEYEPRPAFSALIYSRPPLGKIPGAMIINVGQAEFKAAEKDRKNPGRGGNNVNDEDQMRWSTIQTLENGIDLAAAWTGASLTNEIKFGALKGAFPILERKRVERDKLIDQTIEVPDLQEKMKDFPDMVKAFNDSVGKEIAPVLPPEARSAFEDALKPRPAPPGAPPGQMTWTPERVIRQGLNVEKFYFELSILPGLTEAQFGTIRELFRPILAKRAALVPEVKNAMEGKGEWDKVREKVNAIQQEVEGKLKTTITADQEKRLAEVRSRNPFMRRAAPKAAAIHGQSAFVAINEKTGEAELFDYVNVPKRNAGYKVHFLKDHRFRNMAGINLIFEYQDRFVLAEPLAYEVYRRAGNAAPASDFFRLWIDGQLVGYHLMVEQPNRSFLDRNKLKPGGNFYKILWYESGVVGQHEKKTNLQTGHDDLVALVDGLQKSTGDAQWEVIQKNFNVNQVINYFAVNTVLSHWDGFFNNYFTYHDSNGSRKWEMYPWDQDKTWGFYDGLPEGQVFFDMPLTFGMEGDVPPWGKPGEKTTGFRAGHWWRPGGYFSRPLLANPQFRKLYLARIREILDRIYTDQTFFPVIDQTGDRLKEEVRLRAEAIRENPDDAVRNLEKNLASLKDHLVKRRKFLLEQEELK